MARCIFAGLRNPMKIKVSRQKSARMAKSNIHHRNPGVKCDYILSETAD